MKKQLFTMAMTLCCIFTQAQNWQWSIGGGAFGGYESATACITDVNNNLYVAGNFSGSSITFGSNTLTNGGGTDIFILKINSWGNIEWAKRIGGAAGDEVTAIAADANGDIYLTGFYKSNVLSFGTVFLTNTAFGFSDLFVAKLDPAGAVQWAKKAGGNGDDNASDICLDLSGNVYLAGSFNGASITFGTVTITKSGIRDALIAKLDPNGSLLWAEHPGGVNCNGAAYGVSTDATGNVMLTGTYQGGAIAFTSATLTNSGLSDIFIAKYNTAGINFWAHGAGGSDEDKPAKICIDATGNIFMTGYYRSASVTFGSNTLNNVNAAASDIFLVKYDNNGNALWAKSAGSNGNDEARSITHDAMDNVYIAGYFSSLITFGSTTLVSNGNQDIFIARYNSAGSSGYSKSAGSSGFECVNGISLDATNNACLVGEFYSSSFPLGNTTLVNANTGDSISDMFITMLNHVNAIEDLNNVDDISIFPNPSTGSVTINHDGDATHVQVINSIGSVIVYKETEELHATEIELDQKGVYLVRVFTKGQIISKKLIINN